MAARFTAQEEAVLRIVQADLPASLTPYADIAAQCGLGEEEVLALLSRLKESGAIRRFGASIRHQRTRWKYNAMVAWRVDASEVDACGAVAAQHPHISHSYYRPSSASDWPYTFYTMIHGSSPEQCQEVVDELVATSPLREYAMLRTVRELKKISMTYFA